MNALQRRTSIQYPDAASQLQLRLTYRALEESGLFKGDYNMASTNDFVLTLDIDWAPDFVIDRVAQILIENGVKATWFVTHQSEAIERLRASNELFELGIHPNMLYGSTHGKTEDEVLTYIKHIVPDAISMRTHSLYQTSSWLVKAAKDYGVSIDVSLFLPKAANLHPHQIKWHGSSLWRIPYFWEDDSEMFEDDPIWSISDKRLNVSGLRIFDFHPIHIALNTDSFEKYEKLKQLQPLGAWDEEFIEAHVSKGRGPLNLFIELVNQLAGKGTQIKELLSKMETI